MRVYIDQPWQNRCGAKIDYFGAHRYRQATTYGCDPAPLNQNDGISNVFRSLYIQHSLATDGGYGRCGLHWRLTTQDGRKADDATLDPVLLQRTHRKRSRDSVDGRL